MIITVDSLSIQRSILILENRYRELHELGKKHNKRLKAEKTDLQNQLETAHSQLNDKAEQLNSARASQQELQKQLETAHSQLNDKAEQLNSAQASHQELQKQLETAHSQLNDKAEQLCELITGQKKETSEELHITLLQLHHIQKELDHYFMRTRSVEELAKSQKLQLHRAQQLMERLLPTCTSIDPQLKTTPVEVLPAAESHTAGTSLQTEALLSTYAKSLSRAGALLERAMNR